MQKFLRFFILGAAICLFAVNLNAKLNAPEINRIVPKGDSKIETIKSGNSLQEGMKFAFFNNLDQWANAAYWAYFHQMTEVPGEFVYMPWTSNVSIDDYDVFIFPMGNTVLAAKEQGGTVRVFDHIQMILEAGKKVIILSRVELYASLGSHGGSKDPEVVEFLQNELGMQYGGRKALTRVEGNTTYTEGFYARGALYCPVGLASRKCANMTITYNESGISHTPLQYYESVDFFTSKDEEEYTPVDHFIKEQNDPITADLLGMKRAFDNEAKLIFWCYGFEMLAVSQDRWGMLERGMEWLLKSAPQPGPHLSFIGSEKVNFGNCKVGESEEINIGITNDGVEDLQIQTLEFAEWADPGIFTITSDYELPITIEPDGIFMLTLKFEPAGEEEYMEFLDLTTNEAEGNQHSLEIHGTGGEVQIQEPYLQFNNTQAHFGTIDKGKNATYDLKISNIGANDLIISKVDLVDNEHGSFDILQGGVSQIIDPHDSTLMVLRFFPLDTGTYKARLKITSDASNSDDDNANYVELVGICEFAISVPAAGETSDGLFKMQMNPNPFNGTAVISYELFGQISHNSEIYMVDINGRKVSTLFSGTITPGANTLELNAETLPSGMYYIIAKIGNDIARMPVVNSK